MSKHYCDNCEVSIHLDDESESSKREAGLRRFRLFQRPETNCWLCLECIKNGASEDLFEVLPENVVVPFLN